MGLFDDVLSQNRTTNAGSGLFDDVLGESSPKSSALRRGIADPAISLLKGAISVPEAVVGMADIPTLGLAGKAAEGIGFRPKEAKAELDTWYSPEQQAANRAVQEAKGFVPTLQAAVQNPSVIGHTVAESVPSMLGGAAIARGLLGAGARALPRAVGPTAAPIIAGAAGEGIVGAGLSAEQIRQETPEGTLSPGQSAAAMASGIGTGLIGAAGGGMARKLGLSDVDTLLAGGTGVSGTRKLPARVLGGAVSEGVLEEMPQSAQEQAWQNVALGKPVMEGVPEQSALGGLAGTAMGMVGGFVPAHKSAPGPLEKAAAIGEKTGVNEMKRQEQALSLTGVENEVSQTGIQNQGNSEVSAGSPSGTDGTEQTDIAIGAGSTEPSGDSLGIGDIPAQPTDVAPATLSGPATTAPQDESQAADVEPPPLNTPAAPEPLPSPVSTAATSPQILQAESAGVPTLTTEGVSSNAPQTQEAVSPAPGRKEEPATVSGAGEVTPSPGENSAASDLAKDIGALSLQAVRLRESASLAIGQKRVALNALASRMEAAAGEIARIANRKSAPAEESSAVQPVRKGVDLSTRTDGQLAFLARSKNPKVKALADAEIARRERVPQGVAPVVANEIPSDVPQAALSVAGNQQNVPGDIPTDISAPKSQPAETNQSTTEAVSKKPKAVQNNLPPIARRDDLVGAIMRVTGGDGIHSSIAPDTVLVPAEGKNEANSKKKAPDSPPKTRGTPSALLVRGTVDPTGKTGGSDSSILEVPAAEGAKAVSQKPAQNPVLQKPSIVHGEKNETTEPWRMTFDEYLNTFDQEGREWEGLRASEHRASVQKAVNEGNLSADSASLMGYPDIANDARKHAVPRKLAQLVNNARGVTTEEIRNSSNNMIARTSSELEKLFSGKPMSVKEIGIIMNLYGEILDPFDLRLRVGKGFNPKGTVEAFRAIRGEIAAVIEGVYGSVLHSEDAAKDRKPFVIPTLTTPTQPTTHGAPLEQKAAELPIGKYAKAEPVRNADKLPAVEKSSSAGLDQEKDRSDKSASSDWVGATVLFTSPSGRAKRGSVIRVANGKAVVVSPVGQNYVAIADLKRSKSESTPLKGVPASDNSAGKVKALEYARQELAHGTPHWYVANVLAYDVFGNNSKLSIEAFSYVMEADSHRLWRLIDAVARQLVEGKASDGDIRRATDKFVARQTTSDIRPVESKPAVKPEQRLGEAARAEVTEAGPALPLQGKSPLPEVADEAVKNAEDVRKEAKTKPASSEPLSNAEGLPASVTTGPTSSPIVEHVTAKGKTLRGTVRTDLTLEQARALDKFTFKKDGGYFIRENPTAGTAADPGKQPAPADSNKPDRSKQQAAKLRALGEKLVEAAQAEMGRDRLTNTARRARQASNSEASAAQDKLIGETMIRIADAIEDGRADALAGITARTQVEQLESTMKAAIYRADAKAGGSALAMTRNNNGRPFSDSDLAFVEMPKAGYWISGGKKALIDGIAGKRGAPELRAKILYSPEYTAEIHAKARSLLSDDEIKRAVGWNAVESVERAARITRAGITNIAQLRKAISEYAQIRAAKTEVNKAKALERALIGQKVGVDFFPTPASVAADMVRRAGVEPGMNVLEPSAGNGNIAEAIKSAGVSPDVIEISSSLREILDAKGFNLVGQDFMETSGQQYDRIVMNPPFSNRMDAEHVQHAYSLLKPGGKIVAIMGEGVFFGQDAKAVKFREWLDSVGGTSEKMPQGTFTDRTLMATTSVNSRMVEISRPDDIRYNLNAAPSATTADRAVYDMAQEGKSAAEILSFIGKASRRPFNRYLANALKNLGASSTITLDSQGGWQFGNTSRAQRYAAAYNPRTDTVALFTPREAERHILHELVHAATLKAIARGGGSAMRMRRLFLHVQRSGRLSGQYGMSSLDEFVAEAFSNPRFQEALRSVPAPAGSILKSAWHWFVRLVSRVLGLRTAGQETALDRALTAGAELMRENAALAGGTEVVRLNSEARLAPNGNPSNLNEHQWQQVRTPEFKAWFGDWESAAKLEWLDTGKPIAMMSGDEVPVFPKLKLLAQWVGKYWADEHGGGVVNPDLGRIVLDETAASFSIGHGLSRSKANAFYLVPKVLENGVVLGQLPKVANKPDAYVIAAPVAIGEKTYRELVEVQIDQNMHRMYVHEVVLREESPDSAFNSSAASSSGKAEPQGARHGAIWNFMLSLRKVKASRAVDANGEPLASQVDQWESDQSSGDIRFSAASDWYNGPSGAPVRNAWQRAKAKAAEILSPKNLDKIIYELQDKYVDLKRLREHIQSIGGTITDMNDAYLGEELYHKRLAHRTEEFLKAELRPLLAEMKARSVGVQDLETFLHARHAPEANAEMAKRNPNQAEIDAGQQKSTTRVRNLEQRLQSANAKGAATVALEQALNDARGELLQWNGAQAFRGTEEERRSLSGLSDAAAAAIMNGLTPERRANLDALAARVDALNEGTLQLLQSYGLMSRESLDTWRKTYQYYIPLHRDEAHPDSVNHPIGQGFSVKGDAAKRRTGSNQSVTNILGHIAMQREAALTRGEKNHVMRKLYLMARQNPLADVWKVGDVPTIDTIDKATGFVKTVPDPLYKTRPNVLLLRIAGKDVAIAMNEHNPQALRMAQALKNLDVDDLHYLIPVVGKMTRYFASINTQYNPIFGVINLMRDTQEAALNLSTTELAGKQKEVMTDTLSILKEVLKNKGRMPKTGAWATLFEEFNRVGGTTGYRDLFLDAESRSKSLLSELQALDRGKVSQAAHAVADWLSDYNEAMENATRLAAYKAAIDNGMSKERAASLAKNLTVNFNRKGRQTRELGALYAFFNAAVQGTTRMAQTLSGPAGRKILAGGVLLGVVNALLGIAMMGGAGDEDDEWEKIPEFVKERSIVIPTGKDAYLSIPMPLGFQFLPNIGRLAVEMAVYKDKTAGKQMVALFQVLADAFNPMGGSSPALQIAAPTVLDPFVALAQNKDWTGKPIFIENRNSLDPKPGLQRSKDSATPWAKGLADAINAITGGTEYTPGGWSPTPDQIDYVIGQLTGGIGREAGKVASTAAAPFTGEELPPYKIPLIGRLYGSTAGHSGQSEKFYENVTKANEAQNEIKGRVRAGISVADYLADHPGAISLAARGNVAERQVAALRKARHDVVTKGGPDEVSKVREINEKMAVVMRNFNKEVGLIGGRAGP